MKTIEKLEKTSVDLFDSRTNSDIIILWYF